MTSTEDFEESYIRFDGVSKEYKDIKALDDISISIPKGKIFGYIGPNGAGKTTTIKIMVGLIRNYKGQVFVNNHPLKNNYHEYHEIVGYLPQEVGFQQWRTVDHALTTFGLLSGIEKKELDSKISDVLKLVGLSDVRNKKIKYLSGGMIQKLRLAQAIMHDPEVLVLDEPLTGLDPMSRFQFKQIIKELAKRDFTIFFSSHILSDVEDVADIIGILNNGRIMKIGTPDRLQEEFKIGDDIEIETDGDFEMVEKKLSLDIVESIERIQNNSGIIHLKHDLNLNDAILHLMSKIVENKIPVRNFQLIKPSLEDVYLHFIGGNNQ